MKNIKLLVIISLISIKSIACSFAISASNSGSACLGNSVTLLGSTTATTFSWAGPGGFSSTLLSPAVTPLAAGTYTYTLTATNGTCTAIATTIVTINAVPHSPTITSTPTALCIGNSVKLTVNQANNGTIIVQDFNSSIAPWTIDNSGSTGTGALLSWQGTPDGFSYPLAGTFHSNDNTQFAMANADNSGPGSITSTKLTSPAFSLAGYTTAKISFHHSYQCWTAGDTKASIEVSIDGGSTWTTLHNFAGTNTGNDSTFASDTESLNPFLGYPNCKIRFWYLSNWGWWWAIDNVTVTGTKPALAGTSWSPATNLFLDASFSVPYTTGSYHDSVYLRPTAYTVPSLTYYATTFGSGCSATDSTTIAIYPSAAPIAGLNTVCATNSIILSDITPAGHWSSSNPSVASISTSGTVLGIVPGSASITYTAAGGCTSNTIVTVNALPGIISAPSGLCVGKTTTLSDPTPSGTWSSSDTTVATITHTSGNMFGIATGTINITYSLAGCITTRSITINPLPVTISGITTICPGSITNLSDLSTGGTWSSSSPSIATISSTGTVTGLGAGNTNITYALPTGCSAITPITVNPIPAAISGTRIICPGGTSVLTNTLVGGTWSSSNTGLATIGTSSGVLSGISQGVLTITYSLPSGCATTTTVTVNSNPAAIAGNSALCVGTTETLTDATPAGTWTSVASSIATIGSNTGLITAISPGTAIITYTANSGCATTYSVTINPKPTAFSVTGGGSYCTGGAGVHCGLAGSSSGIIYQLINGLSPIGAPVAGTGGPIDFGLQSTTGIFNVTAVNVSTGCNVNMTGSATVASGALPISYNVTGGGSYCPSSTGVHIGLSNSTTGVQYQLFKGSIAIGSPISGTGTSIDFGTYTINGTYTIIATNSSSLCTNNMSGAANVSEYSTPTSYSVSGGGAYCPGGSGVHIGLNGSTVGLYYQLFHGSAAIGAPVAGTGSAIDLGLQTLPGTYTVSANNTSMCVFNMSGSATIITNATPPSYRVTGGGNYCSGGTGLLIGMENTSPGNRYQLYRGLTIVGSPVVGNGAPISLGRQTISGTYSVLAIDTLTSCMSSMIGTAVVGINPLPSIYNVTGGGNFCTGGTGVPIHINGSDRGIKYELHNDTVLTGITINGTGDSASFGLQTTAGTYAVLAIDTTTSCTVYMRDSAIVSITPSVTPSINILSNKGDTICAGTNATFSTTAINAGSHPTYQWKINGLMVGSDSFYNYLPINGDNIELKLTSSIACAFPQTVSSSVVITVINNEIPTISIISSTGGIVCQGTQINYTLLTTYGGNAPTFSWIKNGVVVGSGLSLVDVKNYTDSVYCVIKSNYQCLLIDSAVSNEIITSIDSPVMPEVTVTAIQGSNLQIGNQDTLVATVTHGGSAPTYQWLVNGVIVPGATNRQFVSNLSNNDSVSCIVTKTGACQGLEGTGSITILVNSENIQQNQLNSAEIRIMPNPNKGNFVIKGDVRFINDTKLTVSITNTLGQTIYTDNIIVQNGKINKFVSVDNIPNGIYFLNLNSENEHKVFQLVVER